MILGRYFLSRTFCPEYGLEHSTGLAVVYPCLRSEDVERVAPSLLQTVFIPRGEEI